MRAVGGWAPLLLAACASASGGSSPQPSTDDPSDLPADISPSGTGMGGSAGAASTDTGGAPGDGPNDVVIPPVQQLPQPPAGTPPEMMPDEMTAPEDQPPPPDLGPLPGEQGTWRGTTGQGGVFSFVLGVDGINRITFEWSVPGCSGLSGGPIDTPLRPVDGRFELTSAGGPGGVTATFEGGFNSFTTASGTASYRVNPSTDTSACSGSADTTWDAAYVP